VPSFGIQAGHVEVSKQEPQGIRPTAIGTEGRVHRHKVLEGEASARVVPTLQGRDICQHDLSRAARLRLDLESFRHTFVIRGQIASRRVKTTQHVGGLARQEPTLRGIRR
jgi:hypothetical protein